MIISLTKLRPIFFPLVGILGLFLLALFSDFILSHDPYQAAEVRVSYAPPTVWRFSLERGFYFHPWALQSTPEQFERSFAQNLGRVCPVELLALGDRYLLFGFIPFDRHLLGSPACAADFHLLGTDRLGRDFLARLMAAFRPAFAIGTLGIVLSFPLGVIYGLISGYRGGAVDQVMMRLVEVLLSLPSLYIIVALAGILPPEISNQDRFFLLTGILSLIGWAGLARVIRGQVLSLKNREYILAARILGASEWHILVRELLPQLSSYLLVAITVSYPAFILGETALSFLGLGINQPDPSLGNILNESRSLPNLLLRPWIAGSSILAIIYITFCFNALGDGLRDQLDSKQG